MDIVRDNFELQSNFSCTGGIKDCNKCFNEIPCHWYLSMTNLFANLDNFFSGFKSKKFLILKEGVVTKL